MAAAGGQSEGPATVRSRPLLHYKDLGLGTQNRKIRFNCVHASENFLACGANNGSVYLYATSVVSRADGDSRIFPAKYHLVKMITPPSNDRVGVTCLSICPQQKRLVVGTMRGVVYGIQLTDYHKIGERVEFSHDFHAGFPITCFLWDKRGHRLFSACNAGLVCQTVLRAGMSAIFGSTDTELLLKEETGIVQLDIARHQRSYVLMVSSQLRVLLLNLTSGDGSAVQIGTKARQGAYGACFFTNLNVDSIDPAKKRETKVFSSRPGRRVWVADPESGKVSSTLKFSLAKNPTAFLRSPECTMEQGIQPRNLTISKLGRFQFIQEPPYAPKDVKDASTLLVSWNVGSSVLFLLDPFAVEIVEWHLDLGIIHDLKIVNETTLVVLHGDSPKVSLIQSCSAQQFLETYATDDVKKTVELALEFNLNDASVVSALQNQWQAHLERSGKPEDCGELTAALEALVDSTKAVEDSYRAAEEVGFPDSAVVDAKPLQVIFKQRPQQQVMAAAATAAATSSDLFSSRDDLDDKEVTLSTGHALHKPIEYFDVLAPSDQTYSKSIYAPDGSTMEAALITIPELPRTRAVLAEVDRDLFMAEVAEEVKQFQQSRSEDGAMNMNLLPALKGGSNVVGKAFSTFIPSSNVLTHLMDGSIISQPFSRADVSGIFGSFPDTANDDLVIDPDPRLLHRKYVHGQLFTADTTQEYSVLRIAMSTIGEADGSNLDTEVLLEAISMDIWDSNLKYTSNLPLSEQLNLPEGSVPEGQGNGATHDGWSKPAVTGAASKVVMQRAKPTVIANLKAQTPAPVSPPGREASSPGKKVRSRLVQRTSMSPDAGRAALRALQKHLGATPRCEIKHRCIVGGRIALSPELEPILRREVTELTSELQSAATTAEKTKQLTRRLWPASGITRVCACLTSLFLFEGDLGKVQSTVSAWLSCFDPSPEQEDPAGSDDSTENKSDVQNSRATAPGFARGEALVDGDGLPLTRGDWNLVRTLVSIYFAICAAGSKLDVHPFDPKAVKDGEYAKLYESETGVSIKLQPRYRWDNEDTADGEDEPNVSRSLGDARAWTAAETESFVAKYGVYLNPDLAAEVCNLRQFTGALKVVLDEVVSSADMAELCDDIVSWISSEETDKALEALEERDSLCLLLHLLDILLKRCPQEATEMCVAKYPVLYPWNVEKALFGEELEWGTNEDEVEESNRAILEPSTVKRTAKYFRYLVRLLEEKGDQAGRDAQVVDRCLNLCFSGNSVVGELFKQENRPDRVAWVAALVRQPQRFVYDHTKCWQLFANHSALSPLLELVLLSLEEAEDDAVVERGHLELYELVTLVMERKELDILDGLFARVAALPHNSEECLAKILGQIQTCVSIEHRNELLSSTVIHALLNAVNLAYGMQLLARFPLLFAATPLSVYHTIVESHVLTQRQKQEVTQMLEIVDTNVWASYKEDVSATSAVSFAPQLSAVLQLEMGSLRSAMDCAQYDLWETKCKQYDSETASHRLDQAEKAKTTLLPCASHCHTDVTDAKSSAAAVPPLACRSFEYRNSDWGGQVQLHDSTCGTCELPVVMIADGDSSLGVMLLPCGHAFHDRCLQDRSCPACLEANLESLDWF